eukprot:gene9235-10891_t
MFYVTNSLRLSVQVLFVNIVLLLITVYIITQRQFGEFHITLDPLFLILVVQLVYLANANYSCYDEVDINSNGDGTVAYVFIQMWIELYETYTFASLPFPQPWAGLLTLISLLKQEIRLFSCSERIYQHPSEVWIVQLMAIVLVQMYVCIIWLPASYLECSFRNRYKSTQLQQQADEAKREMVGFLCTGVRVPLQYMLHSVNSIDFMVLSGDNVQPLLNDIFNYSRMVNEIADDLLLLVRIRENRYKSKPVTVSTLHAVLDFTVLGVLQRHKRGTASPECLVDINVPSSTVSVDEKCLLAVVKHLLIFITQEPGTYKDNDASGSHSNLNDALNHTQRVELNLTVKLDAATNYLSSMPGAPERLILTLSGDSIGHSEQTETRRVHEATTIYVCRSIAVCCGGSFVAGKHYYELTLPCSVVAPSAIGPQSPPSPGHSVINNNNQNNTNINNIYINNQGAGNYNNNYSNPQSPDSVNEFNSRPQSPSAYGPETTPSRAERQTEFSGISGAHDNSIGSNVGSNPRNSSRPPRTPSSNASEPRTSAKQKLDEKLQLSAEMLARFQRRRVCVIAEDSVLENVIINVVRRMHLDEGMSVLHELQKGLVPVAKLTFVTSYQICFELRARSYPGKIVLFSGSINYLDDEQIANVDYCLPLPASDHQLSLFLDWLFDLLETEALSVPTGSRKNAILNNAIAASRTVRNRDRRLSGNSTGAPPVSVISSQSNDSGRPHKRRSRWAKFARSLKYAFRSIRNYVFPPGEWFLVPALHEDLVESFYKWKWLNPSRSWYHHSMELYFTAGPRLLMAAFVETILFQQQLPTVAAVVFVAALYMCKGLAYKHLLRPCNISMHSYFMIPAIFANGVFLVFIFQMISQPFPPSQRLNLSEYLAMTLNDGRDGAQSVYGMIITFSWSRLLGMYLPHPFNLTQNTIVFIYISLEIWVNFQMLLSWQMCQLLQLMFLQVTLLNLIYMTHVEASYRREFKVAHDHILNKAFLDHCLEICQQDIRGPLMFLIDRKNDLMKVMIHATYSRAMIVDHALISKLEPLQMAHMLVSEMVTGFAHAHYTSERNESMPIRANNEIVQLNRAVAGILSGMSSSAEGLNVKIFSEIDNNLAVIRTDWKLLSMILINLVNTALRNIRDFCIAQPRNKDLVNFIKIKIVAIHSEAKLPFVHPRLMLINVCDTSNAASKLSSRAQALRAGAGSTGSTTAGVTELGQTDLFSVSDIAEQSDRIASRYGQSLCEKLVKRVTKDAIFETIQVEAQYSTVQRFTYNYHLTPQTRRAQEFIDAESAKDYLTVMVCSRDYFSNYDRVIRPTVRSVMRNGVQQRLPGIKQMVYLSGAEPEKRNETIQLVHHLETFGWSCVVKYVLKVPSMHTIGHADCVLIDQQLELIENVNISDTVLKLRVCGFNGIIAVVLKEGGRNTELIKDELSRSAADVDLLITAPMRDQNIQALTVALEKKCVRQLLYMNGN